MSILILKFIKNKNRRNRDINIASALSALEIYKYIDTFFQIYIAVNTKHRWKKVTDIAKVKAYTIP